MSDKIDLDLLHHIGQLTRQIKEEEPRLREMKERVEGLVLERNYAVMAVQCLRQKIASTGDPSFEQILTQARRLVEESKA